MFSIVASLDERIGKGYILRDYVIYCTAENGDNAFAACTVIDGTPLVISQQFTWVRFNAVSTSLPPCGCQGNLHHGVDHDSVGSR